MTLNDIFDKIYCINLDTRPDKWKNVCAEFAKHNIIVERVSAINGNQLGEDVILSYPNMNNAEIGCMLSHLGIIKNAINLGLNNILILEDDVIFDNQLNNRLDLIADELSHIQKWDMLYLGGNNRGVPEYISNNIFKANKTLTTHAYALNKHAMDFIASNKINRPIDSFYATIQSRLVSYIVMPVLAWQMEGFSDIRNGYRNYDIVLKKDIEMNRYDIINTLITKYKYKTYLEIGTFRGETFSKIKCENKICVDPVKKYDGLTYEVTSDEFFESIAPTLNMKFDIIFIDGLHICEQVIKDVDNALKYLNENGTIVMHDCNPTMYEHQTVPPSIPQWTGTTWRAFLHYRITRDDLEMYTVNTDWGCGVIRRGNGGRLAKFETNDIPYDVFDQNRTEILNLISINQFIQK